MAGKNPLGLQMSLTSRFVEPRSEHKIGEVTYFGVSPALVGVIHIAHRIMGGNLPGYTLQDELHLRRILVKPDGEMLPVFSIWEVPHRGDRDLTNRAAMGWWLEPKITTLEQARTAHTALADLVLEYFTVNDNLPNLGE